MKFLPVAILLLASSLSAQTGALNGFCDLGGTPAKVQGLTATNYSQGDIPSCTVSVYLNGVYSVKSATYTSGGSVTGSAGQTCAATFLGGSVNGTGTIALTGTNTIAGGTAFTIPTPTGHYATAPTTATLANGTATCSGTANIVATMTPAIATIYADNISTPLANPFTANALGSVAPGKWLFWAAVNTGYDVTMSGGIAPNTYPAPVTLTDLFIGTAAPSSQIIQVNGTPIITESPANFSDTASVTWANPSAGVIKATAVGGASGCGPVAGDNTSTDCGYQNRVGDTATIPAHVSSYGNQGLATNSGQQIVAIGTTPLTHGNGASNVVAIGNDPSEFGAATDTVDIGDMNSSSTGKDLVMLGDSNFGDGFSANDLVVMGDSNISGTASTLSQWHNSVILGNDVGSNDDSAFTPVQFDIIAIGDGAYKNVSGADNVVIGDGAFTEVVGNNTDDDNVIIGPLAAQDIVNSGGSFEFNIAIGAGPLAGATRAANDDIAIGVNALHHACAAHDFGIGDNTNNFVSGQYNVAIGYDAMYQALATSTCVASHAHSVAVGSFALAALTTGSNNTALGDYSGADGYVNTVTDGNSNLTGANNTWIGYDAGPNTTTQLTNTIALGYQAHNTASNQTIIGNSSTTAAQVFGNLTVDTGTNVVFRCATAGALPTGALTINAASCGTTADTGLRVK